jgi:hypothetical protein
MKLIAALAAACLCASALGQGVRYDQRVATVATNVPAGSAANVMAIPGSTVTVCVDGACATKASIFSDPGLSVPTANPLITNGQGLFGFYAAAGNYFYMVQFPRSGVVQGIFPISLGGAGGTNGITALTGDVTAAGPGSAASSLVTVTTAGTCGDATHVGQITKDAKGRVTGCTPVTITGSGAPPAGTPNDVQTQLNGTTFGADPGNFTYTAGTTHQLNTINQSMTGFFGQHTVDLNPNNSNPNYSSDIQSDSSVLRSDGSGSDNRGQHVTATNSGVAGNGGFAAGLPERVVVGQEVDSYGGAAGIHQGIHLNLSYPSSGDSFVVYEGNALGFSSCMWTASSDEGCGGIVINGTQNSAFATGTISSTTGTGDTNPVFAITPVNINGAGTLINDGIIIDTSLTTLHTALTGTVSALWESNSLGIGNLAVTAGTATTSTGECVVVTTNIPGSTVPGVYQTQNFTCTVHDTLALTTGKVFVATPNQPEQCNVLTVSGTTTQTGTISCSKPHPIGSYIFKGGTQGFLDFDDDMTVTGLHSVIYVLGAPDTSHLLIAQRAGGTFSGTNLPIVGGEAAGRTLTGGVTVHPGALCINTNSTNTSCTLEVNSVAWANGHTFASPTGLPILEVMGQFNSTASSPDSPQSGGAGIRVEFKTNTQHSSLHPFFDGFNHAPLSSYMGGGGSGYLSGPPGVRINGPMGNFAEFDTLLNSGGLTSCGGLPVILCFQNTSSDAGKKYLFRDHQLGSGIAIDAPNSQFLFETYGVKAPVLTSVGDVNAGNNLNGGKVNLGAVGTPTTAQAAVSIVGNFTFPGCGQGYGTHTKFDGVLDGREGGIVYNLGFASPEYDQMCFLLDTSGTYPLILKSLGAFGGPYEVDVNGALVVNDATGKAGNFSLGAGTAPTAAAASTVQINAPTAVTAYAVNLPGAQPTAGNTYLSCTAANPAVCTWTSAAAGGVTSVTGTAPIASSGGTTPAISCPTCTVTIASGTLVVPVTALAANTCDASATTATATGAATTDAPSYAYASDPTGVTGYGAGTSGGISFRIWTTTNTFNLKRCNESSSSITPGAMSVNWREIR